MPHISAKKHDDVVERMIEAGVEIVDTPIDVDLLKPVQDGINRQKVENIKRAIQDGEEMHPIVVSREGYVIDGHHRMVAMQELGEKQINCSVVKLPKNETLHVVEYFAEGAINEAASQPLTFWVVYAQGEAVGRPFIVSAHNSANGAEKEAARDPKHAVAKIQTTVPRIYL